MQKQKVAFEFTSQQFQFCSATKTLKNERNMGSRCYTCKEFYGNIDINMAFLNSKIEENNLLNLEIYTYLTSKYHMIHRIILGLWFMKLFQQKKQFVICSFLSEFRTIGELEVIENNEHYNTTKQNNNTTTKLQFRYNNIS